MATSARTRRAAPRSGLNPPQEICQPGRHFGFVGDCLDGMAQPGRQRIDAREVERPAQDRKGRQHHQGHGDHLRAFLGVFGGGVARLAKEDHPDLAAHVEGGQEGCHESAVQKTAGNFWQASSQDLILGPEAGQREDARQRQRADQVHPEGHRHLLAQAAHVAHVARVEHFFMVLIVLVREPGDDARAPCRG